MLPVIRPHASLVAMRVRRSHLGVGVSVGVGELVLRHWLGGVQHSTVAIKVNFKPHNHHINRLIFIVG